MMRYQLKGVSIILLTTFVGTLVCTTAEAIQDVYEYQNSEGVTEFTDSIKADKVPDKHIQIKKMSDEEERQSELKLDKIMEKDQALDKRLEQERQIEEQRRLQAQKNRQATQDVQKNNEQGQNDSNNNDLYDRYYYPRRPGIPNRPIRPIPRPLPIRK